LRFVILIFYFGFTAVEAVIGNDAAGNFQMICRLIRRPQCVREHIKKKYVGDHVISVSRTSFRLQALNST
jgi:hypothetical protein